MAFSVSKSRPFRSLGLYKASGKHAAPKGSAPVSRKALNDTDADVTSEQGSGHRPAHAATTPRLTGSNASTGRSDHKATTEKPAATEKSAA